MSNRYDQSPAQDVLQREVQKKLAWFAEEVKSVANDLGVSEDVVRQMEGELAAQDMAFDGYSDDDDDLSLAPAQYLETSDADPAHILEKQSGRKTPLIVCTLHCLTWMIR